ncbi:uncharacterized protein LOC34621002 [Cyclospora cayetanensis]|uniref:Uncharacterized protein LOC34621002 n=1 Tax=Cyclospora cayetanensis TaxID=88456 RepID=A0A6P6RZJ1_9EIME|nr:uncharacterized protein LOC34621002 [Cyclospora cayetanensis]
MRSTPPADPPFCSFAARFFNEHPRATVISSGVSVRPAVCRAAAGFCNAGPRGSDHICDDCSGSILALLGMRQAVSSLQLSVNQAKTRYVQQQSLAPNPKGSATSSSDEWMQPEPLVFPETLADLRGLDLSHLLLLQQQDELPVFEAVTSLVLRQLRLYSALLRLLPTLCSAEARQVHESSLEGDGTQAALPATPSRTEMSSGLFGSQWHAAAAAESAAMQQLLLTMAEPLNAIVAAAAAAATAAEALTGWLCVLNALGKGFGVVGAQVAVRFSRDDALMPAPPPRVQSSCFISSTGLFSVGAAAARKRFCGLAWRIF